jgi:hypothetical protein
MSFRLALQLCCDGLLLGVSLVIDEIRTADGVLSSVSPRLGATTDCTTPTPEQGGGSRDSDLNAWSYDDLRFTWVLVKGLCCFETVEMTRIVSRVAMSLAGVGAMSTPRGKTRERVVIIRERKVQGWIGQSEFSPLRG